MNINEFTKKMKSELEVRLASGYVVSTKEVMKNNGIVMHGILIRKYKGAIAPTIYMEAFFQQYEAGKSWDSIIDQILEMYRQGLPREPLNLDYFDDFERVKGKIAYKLINAEKNKCLLETIPHIEFLDLAVCFYYAFSHASIGEGSILIQNGHMNQWNVNTKVLFEMAQKNTRSLLGIDYMAMKSFLKEYYELELDDKIEMPLHVLTNKKRYLGACCILYPGVLKGIAGVCKGDYFVLPSSIHEMLILKNTGHEDVKALQDMVREVNATLVYPEEYLSDHVYYYDSLKNQMRMIG